MQRPISTIFFSALCVLAAFLNAEEKPAFRTDGNPDEKLPWFQLVEGEFPPEGSAHYFAGELISVDHLERKFILRVDRTDKQNRSHFDLPVGATMLPYGSIYYHGAPASLRDIPIGTHLHGLYYLKDPTDKSKPPEGWHNRVSIEGDFRRCFRIEDDFTFYSRQKQIWHIDEIDREQKKLIATLMLDDKEGKRIGKPQTFDLLDSTRVWQGREIATQEQLQKGQTVQFNITWATLYGPGRISEIWIDTESRELATAHQIQKHHQHIRQRGMPGWVDEVDNKQRIVTVTIFDGVDPKLFEDLDIIDDRPLGWPNKDEPETTSSTAKAQIAVARQSLMTYDPVNDRKGGPLKEWTKVARQPGSSGVQVKIQCSLLLEGFRPQRIVRVYPSTWPVIPLPKEEEFFGRDE